jgi:hypothetical protein
MWVTILHSGDLAQASEGAAPITRHRFLRAPPRPKPVPPAFARACIERSDDEIWKWDVDGHSRLLRVEEPAIAGEPVHRAGNHIANAQGGVAEEQHESPENCGADWKAIDVAHGPRLPEAVGRGHGLGKRCFGSVMFRMLNAKPMGLTITLADITEEEFRVQKLIEVTRQEKTKATGGGVQDFH